MQLRNRLSYNVNGIATWNLAALLEKLGHGILVEPLDLCGAVFWLVQTAFDEVSLLSIRRCIIARHKVMSSYQFRLSSHC